MCVYPARIRQPLPDKQGVHVHPRVFANHSRTSKMCACIRRAEKASCACVSVAHSLLQNNAVSHVRHFSVPSTAHVRVSTFHVPLYSIAMYPMYLISPHYATALLCQQYIRTSCYLALCAQFQLPATVTAPLSLPLAEPSRSVTSLARSLQPLRVCPFHRQLARSEKAAATLRRLRPLLRRP